MALSINTIKYKVFGEYKFNLIRQNSSTGVSEQSFHISELEEKIHYVMDRF